MKKLFCIFYVVLIITLTLNSFPIKAMKRTSSHATNNSKKKRYAPLLDYSKLLPDEMWKLIFSSCNNKECADHKSLIQYTQDLINICMTCKRFSQLLSLEKISNFIRIIHNRARMQHLKM